MKLLSYEVGCKKILMEAASLEENDSLLILSNEKYTRMANYMVKIARLIGIKDIMLTLIPEPLRPLSRIPNMLISAVSKASSLIYLVDRMPEETRVVWGSLIDTCREKRCKYLVIYDPKFSYLKMGGILADYGSVHEKNKKIYKILAASKKVLVTSEIGTHANFSSSKVTYRSPIFTPEQVEAGDITIQVPEGEVTSEPILRSFTGEIVVDGAITGLGIPEIPVHWSFKDGYIAKVEGDKLFLSTLLEYVKRFNLNIRSLIGHSMAEFAIGTNEWATFDDNSSNSEKVAGSVHFGIGHLREKEMFHIDNVLTKPTVITTDKSGKKTCLIEDGRLLF